MRTEHVAHTSEIFDIAVKTVQEADLVKKDDVVVLTGGAIQGDHAITNLMKVFVVD